MVSAVDDGVGLLLDKLEELQLNDNTIVFFLSDNGGPESHNASDNGVLRDGKSSLFEGGIRVPFAMQWPAKIKGGMVYEKPVLSLDIFATAAHYASAESKNKIDGVNLLPYITGENNQAPHKYLYWLKYKQGYYAIVSGDDKMVKYNSDTAEYYNLLEDISEENNLSITEKSNSLKEKYKLWEREMDLPIPMGLLKEKQYNKLHPNRFIMVNPYKADSLKPEIPDGYSLIWNDEFDTNGKPNEKYWSYENGFVRNEELQWYQSDNANINNGLLVIEGKREKVKNKNRMEILIPKTAV